MYLPLSQLITAARPPDHPVAVRDGQPIPFSQFRADVLHNAARLRAAGCRRGAPACRDSYRMMVSLLALCHAGSGVVMPANMQPGTLDALAGECDAVLTDLLEEMPNALAVESAHAPDEPATGFDPDAIRIDFHTSGSTGTPKRVARSAACLEREVAMLHAQWGDAQAISLASATVSHHHVYGLVFKLLWPLSCGWPFSTATHEVWETLLDELQPGGLLVTSPAHLGRMAGIRAVERAQAPALVLSAGALLPAAAAQDAHHILGVVPTEIFGSTETGACAIRVKATGDAPWQPLPGARFDATADGYLMIRSPAVPGNGWYETADLVELQPDGAFRFRGRADRIVKIEGKRVSLPAVEQELVALPWVEAAAVTIVGAGFSRLGAAVVLQPSGREKLAELGTFRFGRLLRSALSRTQEPAGLPRLWRFVDALPAGEMGKRRDQDLVALFADEGWP